MVERLDSVMNEQPNPPAAGTHPPGETPADRVLPMFYKKIEILTPAAHGALSVKDAADMSFSAEVDHVPLLVNEFAEAQRHYPIVFSGGSDPMAYALLGGMDGRNLFIESDGTWAKGRYVPAYVRRYPFLAARVAETDQWTVCIDREAPMVSEGDIRPLYHSEEPTKTLREAIEFCRNYAASEAHTRTCCRVLHELDLLSEGQASLLLPGEETRRLRGFHVIDRKKYDALPADVIEEWRQTRLLDAVYAHFASFGAWEVIRLRVMEMQ